MKVSECAFCVVVTFQGFPGPPGAAGPEGKPGTQVPILYSNTKITAFTSGDITGGGFGARGLGSR